MNLSRSAVWRMLMLHSFLVGIQSDTLSLSYQERINRAMVKINTLNEVARRSTQPSSNEVDKQQSQSQSHGYDVHNLLPYYQDIIVKMMNNRDRWFNNELSLPGFPCLEALSQMEKYLRNNRTDMWVLKMLDAAGKPKSGILQGAITWPGQYKECYDVAEPAEVTFQSQYCMTSIVPATNGSHTSHINFGLSSQLELNIGLCTPDKCKPDDVKQLVNIALKHYEANYTKFTNGTVLEVGTSECVSLSQTLDTKAIIAIIIYSILALLLLLGTAYDVIVYQKSLSVIDSVLYDNEISVNRDDTGEHAVAANNYQYVPIGSQLLDSKRAKESYAEKLPVIYKVLLTFSAYSNAKKILHAKHGAGQLECLHGIRFLSMTWVILGHSYFFAIGIYDNISLFGKVASGFPFQVIINATFSVDSFFVLSGLLVTYLFMKERKQKGRVNFFMFYFHRVWRLTPPYMLVLLFDTALYRYLSSGPMWPTGDAGNEGFCLTNWWTNLLYVNNLVNSDKMCMGWSWYLANDMQFYWISPLILLSLYRSGILGTVVLLLVMTVSFVITGIISHANSLPPALFEQGMGANSVFQDIYMKPYCRIGPYLVGMFTGYLLYRVDGKFKLTKMQATIGWLLAAALNMSVLYGLYPLFNGHHFAQPVNDLYNVGARTAWGVGLSWVMFACITGNGGFVNTLLSWNGWIPASRLTYCAYLVHPIVMQWYYQSRETTVQFANETVVIFFFGFMAISYGVAFISSLAFESPMMGLERILLKKSK